MRREVMTWGAAAIAFWYLSCKRKGVGRRLFDQMVALVADKSGMNPDEVEQFVEMANKAVEKGEKRYVA